MAATESTGAGIPTARSVHHTAFTVPDLDEAIDFFVDVLGCDLVYKAGPFEDPEGVWLEETLEVHPDSKVNLAMLRAGEMTNFELFEYEAPDAAHSIPKNSDVGAHHVAFYVDDLDAAVEYLRAVEGVKVMGNPIPVGPPQPNAGSRFIYFRTPWGLQMELLSAPEGFAYEADAELTAVKPVPAWKEA